MKPDGDEGEAFGEESSSLSQSEPKERRFMAEVYMYSTIKRGVEESISVDNVTLEVELGGRVFVCLHLHPLGYVLCFLRRPQP